MITLATCSNLAEAELLKSVLEGNGIFAVIPNADTPQPLSGFPAGYQIQVAPEDVARARELFDETAAPQKTERAAPPINPPGTGLFQAAIMADMTMMVIFWIRGLHGQSPYPAHIEEYLASLAPSLAAWQFGYLGYQVLGAMSFLGGLLMLFRVRTGWTLYTLAVVLSLNLAWFIPGGIVFGGWNVFASFQVLLAGGIITFGFIHRREVFGYAERGQKN